MNTQLALDLAASGLTVRGITELRNGHFVARCNPVEWRGAYADRLGNRGWYVIRFGSLLDERGHRVIETDIEVERIVT